MRGPRGGWEVSQLLLCVVFRPTALQCALFSARERGRLEVGKRGGHRTAPLLMRRPLTGLCRQQLLADEFTS